MSDIKENLKECYESITKHQDEWAFYSGIEEYVGLVLENPEAEKIINSLDKERNTYKKNLSKDDYDDKNGREVWGSWERLHRIYIAIANDRYKEGLSLGNSLYKAKLGLLRENLRRIRNSAEIYDWVEKEKYGVDMDRLHRYLIRKITADGSSLSESSKIKNENSEKPEFKDLEPFAEIDKDGMGCFKFRKSGKSIKVGKPATRKFRLLQFLTDPHCGTQKALDSVFDAIKLQKDEKDRKLLEMSPQKKARMVQIIINTKKELQKIKDFQKGMLKLAMDNTKSRVWLETTKS